MSAVYELLEQNPETKDARNVEPMSDLTLDKQDQRMYWEYAHNATFHNMADQFHGLLHQGLLTTDQLTLCARLAITRFDTERRQRGE